MTFIIPNHSLIDGISIYFTDFPDLTPFTQVQQVTIETEKGWRSALTDLSQGYIGSSLRRSYKKLLDEAKAADATLVTIINAGPFVCMDKKLLIGQQLVADFYKNNMFHKSYKA